MSDNQVAPDTQMGGESKDLQAERIDKLKEIFPEVLSEGNIDFERLQEILSGQLADKDEYYRFEWQGKSRCIQELAEPTTKTLLPDRKKSVDFDNTGNLYIEGDNYDVLKLLQGSYSGKIKMIYIDPPYNTGNDFVYKDSFHVSKKELEESAGGFNEEGDKLIKNSKDSSHYHTNWLNMIYPRLKLAKELMTPDGVIFVSIGEDELNHLQALLNEIFGESNKLANIIWKSGRTSSAHFTNSKEYILCYAKSINDLEYFKYTGPAQIISDRAIKKISPRNPESKIEFPPGIDFDSEDKIFSKQLGDSEKTEIVSGNLEAKNGKSNNRVEIRAAWSMRDLILKWLNGDKVFDSKGQVIKRFFFSSSGVLQYEKEKGTHHPSTIINNISTKKGSKDCGSLFEKNLFDYPKPVELLKSLISDVLSEDSIVLDFFSGSASTAQAVMSHNMLSQSDHKYIMVQLPEPFTLSSEALNAGYEDIASLGAERIRRAAKQIKKEHPETRADLGFKYFKLGSSNLNIWDPEVIDASSLEKKIQESVFHLKTDRSEEDLLFELLLKRNIILTTDIDKFEIHGKSVSSIGGSTMLVCLAPKISHSDIEEIIKLKNKIQKEYEVVSSCLITLDSAFQDDAAKINAINFLKENDIETLKTI